MGWAVSVLSLLLPAAGPAAGKTPDASPVLRAMKQELARSMSGLATQPVPPYFLSYQIAETHRITVRSFFGTLTDTRDERSRLLDVDVRVGSYDLDNTHRSRQPGFGFFPRGGSVRVPLKDDVDAIRSVLWSQTDLMYRQATEQLTRARTEVQVRVAEEDTSADFSREKAATFQEPAAELKLDRPAWEAKIRRATAPFAALAEILQADATLTAESQTRWFVSSEGAEIQTSQTMYRLMIVALTKADDGMELPRYESFSATRAEDLPDDTKVQAAVTRMIADLQALRVAPVLDPYTGPAILSGEASGVFFHEVFGHRIEGHRQKSEGEGQTFKKMIGEKLLPENFSVVFDPTLQTYHGQTLAGFYRFDQQGVRAQRVVAVKDGVFESFLMSRSPIVHFPHSNGHGRAQPGLPPVARQSNLLVEVRDPVTPRALETQLQELIRTEGHPFGLLFRDVQGGFTMTGRGLANTFNVIPILVYRVYPDGREELVRGVDLIGTPLTTFGEIVAGSDSVVVFNGVCGAESGGVPVAAASPDILIRKIEVQKKQKAQDRPPILPAPITSVQRSGPQP
jgi:predicted Zn-dependent protease